MYQYGSPWGGVLMAVLVTLALWHYRPRGEALQRFVYWGAWGLGLLAVGIHCLTIELLGAFNDVNMLLASCYGLWHLPVEHPEAALELWTLPLFETPPTAYWEPFATGDWPYMRYHVALLEEARSFAFARILAIPFGLVGGNFYALTVLVAGAGHWASRWWATRLAHAVPNWAWIAHLALLVPTSLFWTAGLYKESVLWVGSAWVAMCTLCLVRTLQKRSYWPALGWAVVAGGVAVLTAAVKPFWALALVASLAGTWGAYRAWQLQGWARGVVLVALVLGAVWVLALSPFRLSRVVAEVAYLEHDLSQQSAGSPLNRRVSGVGPTTVADLLLSLPAGAFTGLYRPLPGELRGVVGWALGLERFGLLVLTGVLLAAGRPWRGFAARICARPWVIACAGFALIYAALLALSTPNYGTLSRYMAVVWPAWAAAVVGLCAPLPHAKNG